MNVTSALQYNLCNNWGTEELRSQNVQPTILIEKYMLMQNIVALSANCYPSLSLYPGADIVPSGNSTCDL